MEVSYEDHFNGLHMWHNYFCFALGRIGSQDFVGNV